MPFRFRRSFKIMPGVKINISKGGLSTSFGGRGGSLNLGKNGIRQTVGIPGSGLSFSKTVLKYPKSTSKKDFPENINSGINNSNQGIIDDSQTINSPLSTTNRRKPTWLYLLILSLVIICLCLMCAVISMISSNKIDPTKTPTSTKLVIINETFTPLPTILKPKAVWTSTVTSIPLNKTSTSFPIETNTPFLVNTPNPYSSPGITVTANKPCSCTGDLYNCSDFSSRNQAQACYNYCFSVTGLDIHHLDGADKDGKVCESLP